MPAQVTKRRFSVPTSEDLHELRLERGISQAKLAERAGCSQPLIARIENGTVNPPLSTVRRILEVLYQEDASKPEIAARDIAVKPVLLADREATIAQVIDKMGTRGVSQLPVQDAKGRLVGSITEKNLAELIMARGKETLELPVSTVMEPPLPEIDAGASISAIQDLLLNAPAIIVKDGNDEYGILTKTDVLRHFGGKG
ncbi:MAG: CBS domain-containing protein [Candidatus Lokiarchaeota archaeon]|nr:CBS domain-containing protein [Candidatus Lokiarchaeota archaeon]